MVININVPYLQSWTKINGTTTKNGTVLVATSN